MKYSAWLMMWKYNNNNGSGFTSRDNCEHERCRRKEICNIATSGFKVKAHQISKKMHLWDSTMFTPLPSTSYILPSTLFGFFCWKFDIWRWKQGGSGQKDSKVRSCWAPSGYRPEEPGSGLKLEKLFGPRLGAGQGREAFRTGFQASPFIFSDFASPCPKEVAAIIFSNTQLMVRDGYCSRRKRITRMGTRSHSRVINWIWLQLDVRKCRNAWKCLCESESACRRCSLVPSRLDWAQSARPCMPCNRDRCVHMCDQSSVELQTQLLSSALPRY